LIVERSMSRGFLSNSYLVADREGGTAVIVDTGAPAEPLLRKIVELHLSVTHVLCTHHHSDHVSGNSVYRDRFSSPVCCHVDEARFMSRVDVRLRHGDVVETGGLRVRVLHVPGHTVGQAAFVVNDERVFTGDTLFRGSVGSTRAPGHTDFADLRRSVMDVLMELPKEYEVHPGHAEPTTIGEEWETNPFVRVWRGLDSPGDGECVAFERPARMIVRARDYDGGTKCWVRYEDGADDVVPGSRVT
jgi:glyoxylase-like metal-dependent hydrolase (beta-lactamase superfamily II)